MRTIPEKYRLVALAGAALGAFIVLAPVVWFQTHWTVVGKGMTEFFPSSQYYCHGKEIKGDGFTTCSGTLYGAKQ